MTKRLKDTIKGYTIIEISLFLAISSLFAVFLMAGWTTNINRQRYNDTVVTFQSDIQQVFAEVENPSNTVEDRFVCDGSGTNVTLSRHSTLGSQRGMSDCIILGKLIALGGTTGTSSTFFEVYDIIGLDIDSSTACGGSVCANDFDALKATKFVVSAPGQSSEGISEPVAISLEWGGSYKAITNNYSLDSSGNRLFSGSLLAPIGTVPAVMILRSPISGTTRAFGVPMPMNFRVNGSYNAYVRQDNHRQNLRNRYVSEEVLLTDTKKIDFCVGPGGTGVDGSVGGSIFGGRNRVIRIGGTAASVEIAPMEGPGSITCTAQTGFNGVVRN